MQEREVIKLIVRTIENGNQGHVFFKCPRNVPGVKVFLFHFQIFLVLVLVLVEEP